MGFICGLMVGMLCGFFVGALLTRPTAKDLEVLLTYYEEENRREDGTC